MTPSVAVNIGVYADNRIYRDHLRQAINAQRDYRCVISAPRYGEDQETVKIPDIALVDCNTVGWIALHRLVRTTPNLKLIAINADPESLDTIETIRLGFLGFILKDAEVKEVINTIRAVSDGKLVVPESIVIAVFRQLRRRKTTGPEVLTGAPITLRERQVIELVVQGLSNKEIASRLNVATHTVKSHVHNLLQKLELRNRLELINVYLEHRPLPGGANVA